MAVVLGSATWQHSDSHGKQLATSIWGDLRQQFPVVASRDSRAAVYARRFADRVGCHRTFVGGIERGERNPTLVTITKIASALNTTADGLLRAMARVDEP